MQLGRTIAYYRRWRGLTQQEVADSVQVELKTEQNWEGDAALPAWNEAERVADTLGVTVGDLCSEIPAEVKPWVLQDRMFSEDHMYSFVQNYVNAGAAPQTAAALPYACRMHEGQFRRGCEKIPYIYHPLLMACHALALGFNEDEIIATALLHDVLEDCHKPDGSPLTVKDFPKEIGNDVRAAVQLVTKPDEDGKKKDPAWEPKYYAAIARNRLAVIVKILDRCNNISTMTTGFTRVRMMQYITNTEKYVLPLIDILKTTYRDTCYNQAFLLKYQMRSILESLKRVL